MLTILFDTTLISPCECYITFQYKWFLHDCIFCLSSPTHRHMLEIQALQSRQKEEIEGLFTRMGKPPPPAILSPAVAMAGGRRRLKSKSHKSARSSGQPSPVHSGRNSELVSQGFVHFEVNTTFFVLFTFVTILM